MQVIQPIRGEIGRAAWGKPGQRTFATPPPRFGLTASVPVVIAGAGVAGMTAADAAHELGIETHLLEGARRVGGNAKTGSRTLEDGSKIQFTVGASIAAIPNNEQRAFYKKYGIDVTDPRFTIHSDRVFFDGEWVSIDPKKPTTAPWGKAFQRGAGRFIQLLRQALCPKPNAEMFPLRKMDPSVLKWDKQNGETTFRHLAQLSTEGMSAEEAPGIADKLYRFFAANVRSDMATRMQNISGLAVLIDQGADQGHRILMPGGNYYFLRPMYQKIQSGGQHNPITLQTNTRVLAVKEGAKHATVTYQDKEGQIHTLTSPNVLLAIPSHQVPQVLKLPPKLAREKAADLALLANLQRGRYGLMNLHMNEAPLESHTYHKFPDAKWVADAVQTNALGDPELPPGSPVPSVLNVYIPIPKELDASVPATHKELAQLAIDEMSQAWPWLREKIQAMRFTFYPEAMSAPAPGQMTQLRNLDPQISPHVRLIHSDVSGVFAIRGAIDEATTAMHEISRAMDEADTPDDPPPPKAVIPDRRKAS